MSKALDFRFYGTTTTSNASYANYVGYIMGRNRGLAHNGNNGGEAAMGSIVPHSALSCSTKPTPSENYCYGWMWNKAPVSNVAQTYGFQVVNLVNTGSAGSLYPVTATPAAGTLIAYSLRAFVCLHSRHVGINSPSGSVATSIGVVAKTPHPGAAQIQDFAESPTGSLSCSYQPGKDDHNPNFWPANESKPNRIAGYSLQLSNGRFDGEQNVMAAGRLGSPGENVRLVFAAPKYKEIDHAITDGYYKVQVCGGTYTYNTWYHIRMDVIPNSGFDTVKVYTAPINAALGSETWTLRNTITIADTHAAYVDWSSSGHEYPSNAVGFFSNIAARITASNSPQFFCDGLIDKFEFLTKDIS